MKYSCDVVRDLLPLYCDDVCSDASKTMVQEHIAECAPCGDVLKKMEDKTYDNRLKDERQNVVAHHAQKERRRSWIAGLWISAALAVPILVCLIVNLATGHALDWFFIVLTAILLLASLTALPMLMNENKFLWTVGCATTSLILLLLVCNLYTGGHWFLTAVVPILFGLSVVLLPIVLHKLPLKGFFANNKGLIAMVIDTVLLFAVVAVSGAHTYTSPDSWRIAMRMTAFQIILPWVLFLIIRYIPANRLTRAGTATIFGSAFITMINWITERILGNTGATLYFRDINLFVWNNATLNPNIYFLTLLAGAVVGGGLIIAGVRMDKK